MPSKEIREGEGELFRLLIALESRVAALYAAFARRFADRPELRMLWAELAQDEEGHARLLEKIRALGGRSLDTSGGAPRDGLAIRAALDEIARHIERAEREEISSTEALAITIALETSELTELSSDFIRAASHRHPTLGMIESATTHVKRLIAVVDRLGEPELTIILRSLVEKVELKTGRRKTILIVDDEADMVESCARIFRRGGFTCLTTSDSREALALFQRERPDLLLTDLRMPGLDGLELLRQAKRIDPAVPVVVLTAYVSETSAREVLEAGASAYLAKPFTAHQLRSTVEQTLGLQREN